MARPKRLSAEYTMFVILEYLFSNSGGLSISKSILMTKVPELKQQRQDRVSAILNTLENKGLIISTVTPNATFYRISEKGKTMYLHWISEFLNFFRDIRN